MFADLDTASVKNRIINFIRKEFKQSGLSKVIIALSGGIDSTLVTYLSCEAVGAVSVMVVLLPYSNNNHQGLEYSQAVIKLLRIPAENVIQINIEKLCLPFFALEKEMSDLRKGNIMVRVRMTVLFDLAKKNKALVVGTENKSEYLLGYFTRFGDEASDIEPIRALYKTEVRLLAKYLNVPENIINQAPSAGLWYGQTDEGQFGFTYSDADKILYWYIDEKLTIGEIISKGIEKTAVEKVINWYKKNNFKHHLPKIVK